jgi:zeta-carotene desaturase
MYNIVVSSVFVLLCITIVSSFKHTSIIQQKNSKFTTSINALSVQGNEGLLDTSRMERAFKGTGIKIPADKKLKIGIIGAGLGGMVTAMDLSEAGHDVEIFDARRFYGGKVGSWVDRDGNHIEMGLHVFFGCYYNLFGIMKRIGAFQNLRLKEHSHTFVNNDGIIGELDFRLGGIGAPINGLAAFARSSQLEIGLHTFESLTKSR